MLQNGHRYPEAIHLLGIKQKKWKWEWIICNGFQKYANYGSNRCKTAEYVQLHIIFRYSMREHQYWSLLPKPLYAIIHIAANTPMSCNQTSKQCLNQANDKHPHSVETLIFILFWKYSNEYHLANLNAHWFRVNQKRQPRVQTNNDWVTDAKQTV